MYTNVLYHRARFLLNVGNVPYLSSTSNPPAVAKVYLPEHTRTQLLRDARLRKVTEWRESEADTVLIYQPFWPAQLDELDNELKTGLVHPILAYADLVATTDPRNLEVARRIYDEHIAQYRRED